METEQGSECAEFIPSKHKIFISHSGVQKAFAEQLWVDLKRVQHSPFFDKYSLSKGEKYPSIIIEAARQCNLAVVILSEDYVLSKWPMIELCKFIEQSKLKNASIRILPLFYKLSIEECKKDSAGWYEKWKELAARDSHDFNADSCKDALKSLLSWNGEEFDQSKGSEVDYRRRIVSIICKLIPPNYWDEDGIQGRDRLCKMVADKFSEGGELHTSPGVLALGLHGLGGIGKTTICRGMCNYFYEEFSGKVWHLQLPTNPSCEADVVKQLLIVLEKLTEADAEFLKHISTISEAGVHFKKRMKTRVVFLAIDNVWDVKYSIDAARSVLQAGFGEGSKVLVTARSGDVLEKLLGRQGCLMATPAIVEKDAVGILLNHAAPRCTLSDLSDDERFVIDEVVKRYHGHPLALNIFGDVLSRHGRGGSVWREELEKLQQNLTSDEDSVSSMIQTGFDDLSIELKLVFLDVAVFLPISLHGAEITIKDASGWLNSVHRSSGTNDQVFDGMARLHTLRKSTLLDWEKDNILQIHDLIKEHAVKEVRKSSQSRFLWLNRDSDHECLAELSTEGWGKLERIALVGCGSVILEKMRLDHCSAVKALYVGYCKKFTELRLRGMRSLRSLDIFSCGKLVNLKGLSSLEQLCQLRVRFCGELFTEEELYQNLKCCLGLICYKPFVAGLEFSPHIGCLTALETLELESTGLKRPLNLSRCSGLRELRLANFPKLGKTTNLQTLQVRSPFGGTKEVFDMSGLLGLKEFDLYGQDHLISLPSLHLLTQLRSLSIERCESLKTFPDLSQLTQLQNLSVRHCREVEQLQGIEKLTRLQKLEFCGMRLWKFPEFGSLTELRSLKLDYCEVRDLMSGARPLEFAMASLGNLVNLKDLIVAGPCTVTREVLDLSEVSRVESLLFWDCSNLKRVKGFSTALQFLQLLECEVLEAIPDLGSLPKLRILDVWGCKRLALPVDVQKLSTLDRVDVRHCVATVDAWVTYCTTSVDTQFLHALGALQSKICQAKDVEEKLEIRDAIAEEADTIIQKIAHAVGPRAGISWFSELDAAIADTLMCLSWRKGQPEVEMAERIAEGIGVQAMTAGLNRYSEAAVGVLAAVAATGKHWDEFLEHATPSVVLDSWANRGEASLYPCALNYMAQNEEIVEQLQQHGASALLSDYIENISGELESAACERWAAFVGKHRLEKKFANQVLHILNANHGC